MVLQSRNWCFTWNNYSDESLDILKSLFESGELEYLIYGKETAGTTGTPHLQGCMRFKKKKRMKGIKSRLNNEIYLDVVNNMTAMIEYCKKEEDFEEFGEYITNQGKRTDIEKILSLVLEDGIINMDTWLTQYPNYYASHKNFIQDCIERYYKLHIPPVESHPLKNWQADLWHTLIGEVHPRKIIFIVDPSGNSGKTWFTNYFRSRHDDDTDVMSPCDSKAMAFLYKRGTRTFFLDVPLSQEYEFGTLEQIKDGKLTSTKYMPINKRFIPPHVVVMTNVYPDTTRLISDRFAVLTIDNTNNSFVEGYTPKNIYENYHL
jgi:hypothetical protein